MRRPVLAVAAVVAGILVVLLSLAVLKGSAGLHRGGTSRLGYEELLDQGLARVYQLCAGLPRSPVDLGANLVLAREDLVEHVPTDTLTGMVDAFAEAGARHVEVCVGMFPWLDGDEATIAKYDAVAERVREKSMALTLSLHYSTAYHTCASFAEWHEWAVEACSRMAARYTPEWFIVADEPAVLAGQMGGGLQPGAWGSFASEAAAAIRQVSPKTLCAVSVPADGPDSFEECLAIDGLGAVAFRAYRLRDLRPAGRSATRARERGLAARLTGVWRPPAGVADDPMELAHAQWAGTGVLGPAAQNLDAGWIDATALAAGVLGIEGVTFLWTNTFFAYGGASPKDPEYVQRVGQAVGAGERTATYRAFQDAVRQYGPRRPREEGSQ